jgi:outer membrane immunogenic protein
MRRLSLASISAVSAVAFTQIASAADLPRTAPVYMSPAPIYTWTGFYVGLNAGWGWGNSDGISNSVTSSFCNTALVGCAPNQASNAAVAAVPGSLDTNPNGFIGGGQIGYNWQTGAVVWGIEADFQGADIHGDATATGSVVPTSSPGNTISVTGSASQKIDFLGTLRGRLGWTPSPPWLLYVTGGLAYGHTKTNVAFSEHVSGACFCGPDPVTSVENDEWRAGWTVGGGVEWMFAPQWTVKAEYLYYDLGSVTLNSSVTQLNAAATPFFGVGIASEVTYRGSIARAGVNYKF